MCGIVGKINFEGTVSEHEIVGMSDKIQHRGPDDAGCYIDGHVGLGSRRLAIRDLSPNGHMPMVSHDGNQVLVYNGEIYDFEKDKEILKKDGIHFKSESDTEVILYLYKKYGIECLAYLRGMFAFAIYDKEKNIIFGARDRFGEKPFKYYWDGKRFIFASELKAILENSEVKKEVDPQAIFDYLTYQYVPHPHTGFKNIFKLPQAHYFILDLNTRQLEIKKYWDLDYSKQDSRSPEEWKKTILKQAEDAITMRMVADVPLGAFLSGGVDSSFVVAMMAKNSKDPIKTFSIGFEEKEFDERIYASQVAKLFGTDHHEMVVTPEMMIKDLPSLVAAYEEPYGDSSMLPTYYLAKCTKEKVTVALSGDAGDENFAGYRRYKIFQKSLFLKKIPRFARTAGKFMFEWINVNIYPNSFFSKVIRFIDSLNVDETSQYLVSIGYFTDQEKRGMFQDDFLQQNDLKDSSGFLKKIHRAVQAPTWLDRLLYTDFNSYMPDDLMVKVDIATMQTSLEARAPFLDHHFVELVAQIPAEMKLKGQTSKYILKEALTGILPHEILYRKKMGFGVPAGDWFRGRLKDQYRDWVIENSQFVGTIIKRKHLEALVKENDETGGEGRKLWLLLCLELWYRAYFK